VAKGFVTKQLNRRATQDAHKKTNAYQQELENIVDAWFVKLKGKDAYDIDAEIALLLPFLQNAANRHYRIAYQTGLNSQRLDADDLRQIDVALAGNLAYLRNSFAPALKRRINKAIDAGKTFDEAIAEAREPILSRIALYAGAAWVLTNVAKGAGIVRQFGQNALDEVPVRRVLDPRADHCDTCPDKAREYKSWNEMLMYCGGLPADGSDQCHSNCRCTIEILKEGNWVAVV